MGVITPIVWAQSGASTNPAAAAYLALRRWCGGLTLSSPEPVPGLEAFWLFVGALGVLLVIGLALQGFGPLFRQLVDVPGHARLARAAAARVWGAGRLVVASIGFTVLSWTGGQTLAFYFESPERGRGDLQLLFRIRSRSELAFEQGLTAALTPLRDLAGLADNLPALVAAIWLLFRFSSSSRPIFVIDSEARGRDRPDAILGSGSKVRSTSGRPWRGPAPGSTRSTGSSAGPPAVRIFRWGTAWWWKP